MKKTSDELVRLQRVLISDSLNLPSGVVGVLKNDLKAVLNGYFEISGDVDVEIAVQENGAYTVSFRAQASGVKAVKKL